jgi:hypothetical protein
MLKKICHDQVKILLERMETHPEEFLKGSKWDECMPPEMIMHRTVGIISHYKQFNKLEQHLIRRKLTKMLKEVRQQQAYDAILETIMGKEEEPWTTVGTYTSGTPVLGTPSNTYTTTATINANSLTLGNETLDGQTIKLMKEQLMAMRKMGQI